MPALRHYRRRFVEILAPVAASRSLSDLGLTNSGCKATCMNTGEKCQVRNGVNVATYARRLGRARADGYAERLNRKGREGTPVHTEEIGALVVDSAITVHSAPGPGLLESAYRACLAHELEMRGSDVSQETNFANSVRGHRNQRPLPNRMDYEVFLRVLRGSGLGSST